MAEAPPSLPGTLSRPDAQIIIDALNKRLWMAEPGKPVEALPTQSLEVGRTVLFKAAAGVYWLLVYTGEATYPWAKIGGSPYRAVGAGGATSSTSAVATGAPSITIPLAMEANCLFGAEYIQTTTAVLNEGLLALVINGVETNFARFVASSTFSLASVANNPIPFTVAKNQVVNLKYRVTSAGNSMSFVGLHMALDPIRVG